MSRKFTSTPALVVLAIMVWLVVVLTSCATPAGDRSVSDTGTTTESATTDATEEPTEEDAPAARPTKADYTVKLKTLSRQCFGSAGCSIEARVVLGADARVKKIPVELTVKVTGDESGSITETITTDEDAQYTPPEVSISTASSGIKPKVKIVSVEVL
jgi:hypothetical protein